MDFERMIFELYKDKAFRNSQEFKQTISKKFKNIRLSDVYARINDYQIKKYGLSLNTSEKFEGKEYYSNKAHMAGVRKYQKLRRVK